MKKLLGALLGIAVLGGCSKAPAPAPVYPIPTPQQVEWQKMEAYAFVHYGLNTFNDLEWGFGDTPLETFKPTDMNVEQWVQTFKNAGLKAVIATIKHHDGFCLWDTKYGEYNIANSPAGTTADILRDLVAACKKYDMKVGIYISPWDRNHAEYGREEYVEYFHNQIAEAVEYCEKEGVELFEFWFDGANGGDGYYGGAREHRKINPQEYYQYERAAKTIHDAFPNAMIFGGTEQTIRWIGNESGWAGETNWAMVNTKSEKRQEAEYGDQDGDQWLPGEVDVSVRPGWFYHKSEDHQLRSLSTLVDYYYESVGRNANLLLSFAPEHSGRIPVIDSVRVMEWRKMLDEQFAHDLALSASMSSNTDRGYGYKASEVNDDNWDSYWATPDGVTTGELTLNFAEPTTMNTLLLQEYIPLGQRVIEFKVEYENENGNFTPITTKDTMSTIGYKRIIRFDPISTKALKVSFTKSRGELTINNMSAYLAPVVLDKPKAVRDMKGEVTLSSANGTQIYYTTNGQEPTQNDKAYKAPFKFAKKGVVKAIAIDPADNKLSDVATVEFDVPTTNFKIVAPKAFAKHTELFDGNEFSTFYLPLKDKEVTIDLGGEYMISGIKYLSDQNRWSRGPIHSYAIKVDGKVVKSGEFSNIKNNPLEQVITFPATKGSKVTVVANATADGAPVASFAEFSIITQ